MPDVRTPLATTTALELGHKLWRKQIIREGKISYKGGEFDASPAYLDSIVASFRDKAIGSVPFVFVDDKGAHSEAPERRRGKVVGLERTPVGIDALLQLSDDAEKLVEDDPEFGVSVLVKHDRTTGEGKHFPAVLCHVAGTYDPVLSLQPWAEELAASNAGDDLLDLLALTTDPSLDGDDRSDTGGPTVADTLTPDELAALRSLASVAPALTQLAAQGAAQTGDEGEAVEDGPVFADDATDTDADGGRELSDDEIAEMVRSLTDDAVEDGAADVEAEDREPIAASSGPSDEVLALSQRLEEAEQGRRDDALRLAQVENELARKDYLAERDTLAREFGIHPTVTDIIRPLIEGRGVGAIALANGDGPRVDVAETVRRFAKALASRPRLDLSNAVGTAVAVDGDDQAAAERDRAAFLAQARAEMGG